MATFIAIPEKTQNTTAMKRVIDYVMQDKKTIYNGIKLVGGMNCVPDSAFQEFIATKQQYRKTSGVFFKQYVQSFKHDCGATPLQIHQIGLETAKAFDGYEVIVATHIDRDHWHNHFVVNSVGCETGLKIQINEKGLEQLRHHSDAICQQFGLETLKPYEKPRQKTLSQHEYRAAIRGDSKKLRLTNAIDFAVAVSRSKEQFIQQMQNLGYGVKWIDHYKFITYTTPDGQRFRDNRLLEDKYSKKNMEELFAYEYSTTETDKSDTATHRTDNSRIDRTDTTGLFIAQTGSIQSVSPNDFDYWTSHCNKYGFDFTTADLSRYRQLASTSPTAKHNKDSEHNGSSNGLDEIFRNGTIIEADRSIGEIIRQEDGTDADKNESQGSDSVEAPAQMGIDWFDTATDGLYLAANLAMMGGDNNDEKSTKPKYVRERKSGHKKRQTPNNTNDGMQLNM